MKHRRAVVASVGYQQRNVDDFIDTMRRLEIEKVIDIRELPLSRRKGFSKTALTERLAKAGIVYRHVREAGNPYRKREVSTKQCLRLYMGHLGRNPDVIESVANELRGKRVAILCYEREHNACHRSVLIQLLRNEELALELIEVE